MRGHTSTKYYLVVRSRFSSCSCGLRMAPQIYVFTWKCGCYSGVVWCLYVNQISINVGSCVETYHVSSSYQIASNEITVSRLVCRLAWSPIYSNLSLDLNSRKERTPPLSSAITRYDLPSKPQVDWSNNFLLANLLNSLKTHLDLVYVNLPLIYLDILAFAQQIRIHRSANGNLSDLIELESASKPVILLCRHFSYSKFFRRDLLPGWISEKIWTYWKCCSD